MKPIDVMTAPWAIVPKKLTEITDAYASYLKTGIINKEALNFSNNNASDNLFDVKDGTAIINIEGIISKKLSWLSFWFGGTSTLETAMKIKAALEDPNVKSILLMIDSPGGSVDGTAELSDLIFSLRGDKPIIAFTDGIMTSAAFWIGSAADQRLISGDTTAVGSIGVMAIHVDRSRALNDAGLDVTEIVSGRFKNVGTPNQPLSREHKDIIQAEVDFLHEVFVNAVARNLGVSVEQVIEVMTTDTDPPIFTGTQAVKAGLVDGVATFDDLIRDLSGEDNKIFRSGTDFNKINLKNKEVVMNSKELKEKHPDTYAAIIAEGKGLGVEEGKAEAQSDIDVKVATAKTEGIKEGAVNETQRIKDVQSQSIPGQEKLIQECINDGVTTGAEAAVKVVQATKALMDTSAKKFDDDGNEIDVKHITDKGGEGEKDFMSLVKEHKEEEKCSQGKAIKAIVKSHPEAYAKYLADLKNKKS